MHRTDKYLEIIIEARTCDPNLKGTYYLGGDKWKNGKIFGISGTLYVLWVCTYKDYFHMIDIYCMYLHLPIWFSSICKVNPEATLFQQVGGFQ